MDHWDDRGVPLCLLSMGPRDLNWSPNACVASALPSEPFAQPFTLPVLDDFRLKS